MDIEIDRAATRRLQSFLDGIGKILGNPQRRDNFARYALGLIGDGDRKSVEPSGQVWQGLSSSKYDLKYFPFCDQAALDS